ncbi:MAG TPA: SgcJ/EcaC family oxidoreductase [Pyrinomonadaceae bacterium]|nr:SgcJ/EcaC family oxidoreductase [Pyrinomonadaceae bacterium]
MRSGNTLRRVTLALAALAACALYSAALAAGGGADEAAMRENVRQMEAGWNAKSGAQFARPFADDADYVVINGTYIKGREAIAQAHQGIFDTIYRESTLSLSVKQVRMLRPDVAVVHANATNKVPNGAETRTMEAIITLVMTKEAGAWKIAAFQNTQVAARR